MSIEQELLEGTWRVGGIRHFIYRMTEYWRDGMRVGFNTACRQHWTSWGRYDIAGRWRLTDGLALKEPRLSKGCVTCLECLTNPIPEK